MKTPVICLALVASLACASARDVTFAWDANPEPDVVRYELEIYDEATGAWLPLGSVADNPSTPENDTPTELRVPAFPDRESRVRARAVNAAGLRSLPSDELLVRMPPVPPKGLRYRFNLDGTITLTPIPE